MRKVILTLSRFLRILPPWFVVGMGCSFGWFLHQILHFRRSIVRNQLAVIYGSTKTKEELRKVEYEVYRHLGLTVFELLALPGASREKLSRKFEYNGHEHLKKALDRKKGVFLLTGHIGNWELAGIGITLLGHEVSAVAKEMKTELGNTFIKLMRDDNGPKTIARRNSMKEIIGRLKRNGLVAFMIDQNMTAKEGVFVDFFGHPACTVAGLAAIAQRTGAAVVPAFSNRNNDLWHHTCVFMPEIELKHVAPDGEDLSTVNTQILTGKLEKMINQNPTQYLWIHKRWRTRPPSEENSPFNY